MAARSGGGGTSLDAATASSAASAAGEPVGDASKAAPPPAVVSGPMQAARRKSAGEAGQAKERRGGQTLADEKSKTLARNASPAASEAASNKSAGAAKPAGNARDATQLQGGSGKFGDAFPWLEMRSPSGSIVWRAGRAGAIERSADRGVTWARQSSPVAEDWLAGAAASETACWLVGRNGAIARTADGSRWERIAGPADLLGTQKLPDWTAISVRDTRSATITSRDARRFSTQDGGRTWQAE